MPVAAPELVAPSFHWCPPYTRTDGPLVAEVCEMAGYVPDPEQLLILDDLFAVGDDDRAVAFETAVVAPRQTVKSSAAKMACLGWLYVTEQRLTVWSAHEFRTAQEAFRDMDELCASHPSLASRVARVWRGNGDEAIELKSGARLIFKARTKGGGRGLSGDKVVLDEAFALRPMHMGALLPTLSARPDPQVLYASSAGLVDSDVLRGIRDRGRAGGDSSLAYVEWCDARAGQGCASEECDHAVDRDVCALDDVERWRLSNPSLDRRITVEYIAAERRALPPEEFARERLGWWDDPGRVVSELTVEAWDALADGGGVPSGRLLLGADVAPWHRFASITVVGDRVLELVENRPGSAWLVDRLAELVAAHGAASVAVDPAGPIGSLVPDLEKAQVPLTLVTGSDAVRACGALVRATKDQVFTHRGEPELRAAVAGVRLRAVGDGEKLSRRDSTVNISPLVAAMNALWAAGVADDSVNYDLLDSVH